MDVTATRSGDWWALEAEHQGQPVYTQAKRLDQAAEMVRDAFATLDIDVSAERVFVIPRLARKTDSEVAATLKANESAAEAARLASEQMRRTVADLRGQGLTVRDVAQVLHVSPQRVSQLAASQTADH